MLYKNYKVLVKASIALCATNFCNSSFMGCMCFADISGDVSGSVDLGVGRLSCRCLMLSSSLFTFFIHPKFSTRKYSFLYYVCLNRIIILQVKVGQEYEYRYLLLSVCNRMNVNHFFLRQFLQFLFI